MDAFECVHVVGAQGGPDRVEAQGEGAGGAEGALTVTATTTRVQWRRRARAVFAHSQQDEEKQGLQKRQQQIEQELDKCRTALEDTTRQCDEREKKAADVCHTPAPGCDPTNTPTREPHTLLTYSDADRHAQRAGLPVLLVRTLRVLFLYNTRYRIIYSY